MACSAGRPSFLLLDLGDRRQVIGTTDELGWNIVKDPVHINDLHATIL